MLFVSFCLGSLLESMNMSAMFTWAKCLHFGSSETVIIAIKRKLASRILALIPFWAMSGFTPIQFTKAATKEGGRLPTNEEKDADALQRVAAARRRRSSLPTLVPSLQRAKPVVLAWWNRSRWLRIWRRPSSPLRRQVQSMRWLFPLPRLLALRMGSSTWRLTRSPTMTGWLQTQFPSLRLRWWGAFCRIRRRKTGSSTSSWPRRMRTWRLSMTISQPSRSISTGSVWGSYQRQWPDRQQMDPRGLKWSLQVMASSAWPASLNLFHMFPATFPPYSVDFQYKKWPSCLTSSVASPWPVAGVERALECYILKKRSIEHGKLLSRKFLKPSDKRGLGYGEMLDGGSGALHSAHGEHVGGWQTLGASLWGRRHLSLGGQRGWFRKRRMRPW